MVSDRRAQPYGLLKIFPGLLSHELRCEYLEPYLRL